MGAAAPDPMADGERVLWRGRPAVRWWGEHDPVLVPLTLVGFVVSVLFAYQASRRGKDAVFSAMAVVFVLASFYCVLPRFLVRYLVLARSRYTLTNRRAIAETCGVRRTVALTPGCAQCEPVRGGSVRVRFESSVRAGVGRPANGAIFENSGIWSPDLIGTVTFQEVPLDADLRGALREIDAI